MSLAVAAAVLVASLAGAAQSPPPPAVVQYIANVWKSEQGLPQNTVTAMLQDRRGYLWIGTFGGLARFDGVRFRVFGSAETRQLESERILCLYEDHRGDLWVGTVDGGVTRFNDHAAVSYTERDGLPSRYVTSIGGDRHGGVWINTAAGVVRYGDGKLQPHPTYRGTAVKTFFLEDRDDGLWFEAPTGELLRFGPNGSTTTIPAPGKGVVICRETADGDVWIVQAEQGRAQRYHNGALSAVELRIPSSPDDRPVLDAAQDRAGNIVLLTTAGLVHIGDGKVMPPEPLPTPANGVEPVRMRRLLVDREDNLWAGTAGAGLIRFRRAPLTAYGSREGLADSEFYAIYQDRDGRLWFAGNAVYYFDGREFHLLPGPVDLRTIAQTSDGDMWFGGYGGLYRWSSGVLTRFPVPGPVVTAIHQDREGVLWIGSASERRPGGLYRLRGGTLDPIQGITDVRSISEDRGGGLWLGSLQGLWHVHDGETRVYRQEQKDARRAVLQDIYQDPSGSLWIATYGGGVLRFRDGRFVSVTSKEGLPNNLLRRILPDAAGNLWFSSNQNVFRLTVKELDAVADGRASAVFPVSYGMAEGMRSSECNGGDPGGWRTADGRLWFPTLRGVVAIDPAAFDRVPPPVVVEEASAGGLPLVEPGQGVAPGRGTFDFHYAALSFSAPDQVRFKYRLEPFDKQWIDAGTARSAHYTNMPPDTYAFRVIAANSYGVWNEQGATVRFALRPHFYQTPWFYVALACGVVLLAGGAHRLRVRHLRSKEAELQRVVDSRTAELVKARAELEDRVRDRTAALERSKRALEDDITVRRRVEDELRRSEDKFAKAFQSSPAAMTIGALASGLMIDVNAAFERLHGIRREDAIGRTARELGLWADPKERDQVLALIRERRSVRNREVSLRTCGDGKLIKALYSGELIPFGGEECLLSVVLDVTEQQVLQEQLRQAQRMEALGQLAGGIAHDFNNLLEIIVGYDELALSELPPDGSTSGHLLQIRNAAERAAALTGQLLAFSRKQILQPTVLDLNELVASLATLLRRTLGEGIKLLIESAPDLGAVRADRGQIDQVLLNLCVNARDAMPRGGTLTIATANLELDEAYARTRPEAVPGSYVMLAVSDTGIGMDPATRERIFEPFFTTKERGKGTGLGLATVYGIVKQSGGHIWVYSEVGRGTIFKICLPRVAQPARPARETTPALASIRGTETILVVEDEEGVRKVISEAIRRSGYRVLTAASAEDALELCAGYAEPIHLLVTDLIMPGKGGLELSRELGRQRADLKVLYLSGYSETGLSELDLTPGRAAFLQKPCNLGSLLTSIRHLLEASST